MTSFIAFLWKVLPISKVWQLRFMRVVQDQFLVGVTGVIFNEKDEVLLFRHTYRNDYEWSLPGGYMKKGEHPKEGIEREIEEESGFIVSADTRFKIRTDRQTARLDIVYVGKYLGGTFRKSTEVDRAEFFSFRELPDIRKDQLMLIRKILERRGERYYKISIASPKL